MRLPELNELATSRDIVDVFGGYNHNLRIGGGEFYDMKNLTSSYYPVLSPRSKRGTYKTGINPKGMIAKDSLCYVDGSKFVINEYDDIDLKLNPYETVDLISMGAYVIVITKDAEGNPIDKKYVNTEKHSDCGDIEAEYTNATFGTNVYFSLCKMDGSSYSESEIPSEKPAKPKNMELWIDTSTDPHSLKQWSESAGMWVTIATTYIKISSNNIGALFKQYDGVTISGINKDGLTDLNANMVLWEVYHDETNDGAGDYIVVVGMLDKKTTQTLSEGAITIERRMPTMQFVIESENRLWGCNYGIVDGKVVNELYACKLGDFKNWNCFMGLSTDSYVASVGTDGQFTGAITHLGYPLFFKETCLHKVFGNYPANYQIQTTACRGVQEGSEKSLAIVNEVLYYKGRNGVCAYDGSLPTEMSASLGDISYSNAVAAAHNNKYYISMKDNDDRYNLFVYDAQKGLWHKEDNIAVKDFCSCRNELYYIIRDNNTIKTMCGSGELDTDPIPWMAETGIIGTSMPDKKYVSRINVRMALDIGTRVYFYAQYDSNGVWEHLCTMTGNSLRSFTVPIKPKRCDHFRLKIEGEGNAKIYSITKTLEEGSDL